jgi:transcriptional regulator with XRE-family HTH domain
MYGWPERDPDLLVSRRARITLDQAGPPAAYGGNRRVAGLRREEVAVLAGVSVDYYTRLERGNAQGASASVLEALARALRLDEAVRTCSTWSARQAPTVRRGRPAARPAPERAVDP